MTSSDKGLLDRWIAARDATAFNEIVTRYSPLVYGACWRLLRNEADAEEVAQECFLKLARFPTAPRKSLGGWLHKLATHRALDLRKAELRRRRREEVFAETKLRGEEPAWEEVKSTSTRRSSSYPKKSVR